MTSAITLYYKSLVNKDKNFVLDDGAGVRTIETYLATLTSSTITDFQYIKHRLTLSIKINMNQTNLDMVDSNDLNYVKIQNGKDRPYYYFVISKNWRAINTIELVLSMDTINTFTFNEDYIVDKKSLTKRMHKDRLYKQAVVKIPVFNSDIQPSIIYDFNETYLYTIIILDDTTGRLYRFKNVPAKWTQEGITNLVLNLWLNEEATLLYLNNINSNRYRFYRIIYEANTYTYTLNPTLRGIYFSITSYTGNYIRKIDLKSEDISAPVYKDKDSIVQEKDLMNWALYYKSRTTDENSPIDCFLVTEEAISVIAPSSGNMIDVSSIPSGKIILITSTYQGNLSFKINGSQTYTIKRTREQETYETYDVYDAIGLENNNGQLRVHKYRFIKDLADTLIEKKNDKVFNNATCEFLGSQTTISGYEATSVTNYKNSFPNANFTFTFSATTTIQLNTKDSINKTLAENLKIINIPYCPSNFSIDANNVITISPEWTFDATSKFLRLTDLNTKFKNLVESNTESFINQYRVNLNVNLTDSRKILDSKLFHSDYYRPKFVYDSFTKIFPLEQIDYYNSAQKEMISGNIIFFKFEFVMSRNIVSKFLFKFDFEYIHSNEDYPNIVAVSRNNEEALYNSQYLNYIRTGYNYDLKSKERQEVATGVGIGLSVAGLVATGIIGSATGNPLALGGAIASGIGLATSLVNYAKTTAQNEENIQRKLVETQRQSISVLNADDYDLLYEYSSNKAKLCTYKVSSNMEKILDDLFYYAGYNINEQMIPNINSRYWFNFVQASLIINESSNLTSEVEDDIKEKFEQGITFLHYHNQFDFDQEKENWETSIL